MASNDREVKLRVSAETRNLNELQKAAETLEKLEASQLALAKASGTAGKSLKDLEGDFQSLNRLGGQLNGLNALIDQYQLQLRTLRETRRELKAAQQANRDFEKSVAGVEKQTKEQNAEQKRLVAALKAAEKANNSAANGASRLKQQLTDAGIASGKARTELARLVEVQRRQFQAADANVKGYDDRLAAEKRITQELERQRRIVKDRIAVERQVKSGFASFSQNAAGAPQRSRLSDVSADSVARQERLAQVLARYPKLANDAAAAEQRKSAALRTGAQAATQSAAATTKAAGALLLLADQGRKSLSVYQRVRGELLSLAAAYVGIFGVQQFATNAIQAQNDRIALNTRLLVANGNNANDAGKDFQFLRSEADRLGFSLNNLGGVYSRLRIAASAANLTTEEAQTIFSNFAEVSRVFNLSADDTAGVFRALEQILSKGKIQAEELRGQLGDRLPGAATILARALNVTDAELNKLLETGSISSRELIRFSREYASVVAGQVPNATKTLSAEIERLKSAYQDFLIVVAESGLNEALRKLTLEFRVFFTSAEGKQFGRDLGQAFLDVARAVKVLLVDFGLLENAGTILKTVIAVLAAQFARNLIVGIIETGAALRTYALAATGAATVTGALTVALRGLTTATLAFLATPLGATLAALTLPLGAFAYAISEVADAQARAKTSTDEMRKALDELKAARGTDEEGEYRRRAQAERNLAFEKLKVAEATLAQAEAEIALKNSVQGFSGPEDRSARAGAALFDETRLARLRANVAQLRNGISEADRELTGFGTGRRGGRSFAEANRDGSRQQAQVATPDPEEVQKRLDRIAELREQANAEAIDQLRQLLTEMEDNEETALAARTALINLEADQRIAALQKVAEEARRLGAEDVARQTELNIAGVNAERARAIEAANREANEQRAKDAAEALREEYEKQQQALDNLIAARDRELEKINLLKELGTYTDAEAAREAEKAQLDAQDGILKKIQEIRDLILANRDIFSEMFNVDEVLGDLDAVQVKTELVVTEGMRRAQELREQFAQGATNALMTLGVGIANVIRGFGTMGDAIRGARDAFLNFAADFLTQIAQMILQAAILKALQNSSMFGGLFSSLGNATVAHSGAIIGQSVPKTRQVSPWLFAGAPRYHSGGVVGLAPDEVPAILQKGEEVLAKNDPRNVMNGGASGGGGGANVQIVNAIDSESVVEAGLSGAAGRRIIMNIIQANKGAFRQVLA